ncbi:MULTISPECIES: twin-arginine translocase TatA/TatE family subunit [Streptomyces]|uniref:Twin-arginine translocase TatA/TatE family subunit n=1 Tax=Streptomyces olivaceus TaxID=47716 RepID=A0ABS7W2R7_STROV|nr:MULTISPECIES: twin-arginine translocase TatA/TatE family subunit [Streptomyces]MBZ6082540.1 twin-arginine translocase TatA/TatE family subunit [Streptomyces olivaceus]MBZ6088718.1 twin-arginine translocase TatA/TatE family subunit [Streptomyces olivaceus]MBZ6095908.1 twin-arginine translocase TatA/TatE family subunit [Streptomyces olivaceus]MBZ6104362.1 twin-arginine translocase TatA/TatE family subunit [Streptomyces olivaceus]MBZ6110793.1 twin-arginine translocase TatA/TatE family subunit 
MFGLSELAIILIVLIAVLAAKKLPELTRSAGKSARILKAEARAAKDQDEPGTPRVVQGEAIRREDGGTRPADGTGTGGQGAPRG